MMSRHLLQALHAIVLVSAAAVPAAAQRPVATVSGEVTNETGSPVAGAIVHLETLDMVAVTDARGRFEIDSVIAGSHTIMVAAARFISRRYRFRVLEGRRRANVGSIVLGLSDSPNFMVVGTVNDAGTGVPIPRVPIRVNGRVVAVSGVDGRFVAVVEPTDELFNVVEARRIGYRPAFEQFVTPEQATAEFVLGLEPAPVELAEIMVEAAEIDLSTGRLEGFYRRRDLGLGHFFTRLDIQKMNAMQASDIIRRIPGVTIITEDMVNVDVTNLAAPPPMFSQLPKTTIQFQQRRGFARQGFDRPCSPIVFVNDVRVNHQDFDTITRTRDIAGMEVYTSAAQVPVEYNRMGAACGVIALWTDGRTGGGRLAPEFEIGAQFVAEYDGSVTRQQLGVQMLMPLFGRFELRPSFSIIVAGTSSFNAGWQAVLAGAVHPLNRLWPWYLGGGVAATRVRPAFSGALSAPRSDLAPVIVTGLAVSVGVFRPFAELQSHESFGEDRSLQMVFGATIRTSAPPVTPF